MLGKKIHSFEKVPLTDPLNGNRTGPAARDSFNKSSLSSDVVGICRGERSEASFNEQKFESCLLCTN